MKNQAAFPLLRPSPSWQAEGAAVIRREAEALTMLAEALDDTFDLALQRILDTPGHVIVSGMGKAGHVGRKIAATFSATGSPAFFIHPTEAAHGDLGVLKGNDTLVALSNSGSTPEVLLVVRHVLNAGGRVIAITGNANSQLARMASVALVLPSVAEACPEGIAPTTSSTMTLALGDALAIATMRARGFSRTQLIKLHPGGSIGWRSQPVERLIRHDLPLPLVTRDTPLHDVILKMTEAGKGIAGIVDETGLLLGVITDGDLRRGFESILSLSAGEVMTRDPKTVTADTTIGEAGAVMADARINVLFVLDPAVPRRPVGVIHVHDLAMIG